MKSTLSRRLSVIGFFAAFIALCAIFVWQVFTASEREVDSTELQRRLEITAQNVLAPSSWRNPDDGLRLFAVNIIHTALPWREPFVGYGVYLGKGLILTAAHVVGRVPFVTHPRVLIAGMDLPAKVIKEGSKEGIDLALLSVDQSLLPVSLGLRRSLICKVTPPIGTNVVVAYPEREVRSEIISPLQIAPQYRAYFTSLINEAESSGAGLFDARTKCLLGIISKRIEKTFYRKNQQEFAGYFVPSMAVIEFVSPQSEF